MKKTLKVIGRILLTLVLLVAAVFIVYNIYNHVVNLEFFTDAQKEFRVPGIYDGLVQQGIFRAEDGNILVCGYMRDGSASRIYLLDPEGKVLNYVSLRRGGEYDCSHTGGICSWRGMVFVTADDGLSVYSYDDVKNAREGEGIDTMKSIELGIPAAYCYVGEEKLYVGEFFREKDYPTDPSHHLSTPAGDTHHAIMLSYSLDDVMAHMQKGADLVPTAVYSVPDLVQGVAAYEGKLCLCSSYGAAMSHLRFYDEPRKAGEYTFNFKGKELPLCYLDSAACEKNVSLYPMAEEIYEHDGRIYIINESASSKHLFGRLTCGKYVYSYEY